MTRPIAATAALTLALIAPAAGGQMVEAPIYSSWSEFEPGTTLTLRTVTESQGSRLESTTTQRLVSIDDSQAVVEQVHRAGAGDSAEESTLKLRHRRWFPLPAGMTKEDIGKPINPLAEGSETLELAGRTFEARWYETKDQTEAGRAITRTWYSDEAPGQLLKAVTRVDAAKKTTTIELTEITTP
ncbi:hypothetical protein [Tautonia plasticadhaerens]|uniref:DUF3108 domain-containing protein n=1 Tax=Tautonia plasticadhaerens TaxID=2527974 RepID=A0A518GWH2_9BACT|nr:hypothetical protein [Tautonia plasticadhaerens]QDV32923.1 hypothetical protein ElP_07650 [Tautonia plasticadhaerens]